MSSMPKRIVYSGCENNFVYFAELFDARMHSMKLGKVLTGDAIHEGYMPTVRNGASEQQRTQTVNKRREKLEEKKMILWYELFLSIRKKSVLLLRPHKGDGTKA